jgi:splicing factor 3A subunit 2
MDFQHREGATGSAGIAGAAETNVNRRERLRRLAMETIELAKDPYFMKNHLGSYECKLCLTLHTNEGSYLAHTQGKKHQQNLARRAAKEAALSAGTTSLLGAVSASSTVLGTRVAIRTKQIARIGRPGYKVTKIKNPDDHSMGFLVQVHYPQIARPDALSPESPVHRFMSAFEQKVEPADRHWQYLAIAADPYDTIAFKIPSKAVLLDDSHFFTHWDLDTRQFTIQFMFQF